MKSTSHWNSRSQARSPVDTEYWLELLLLEGVSRENELHPLMRIESRSRIDKRFQIECEEE